jgi:hypothetical protein
MARQITDPRAPFATIDEALDIGLAYLRQLCAGSGSPMGAVAEEQPGGYFVRVAWLVPVGRGGRAGRKQRQQQTAEIGKIAGDWPVPLNDTTLSGKPFFYAVWGWSDEEQGDEFEPVGVAQARLVRAHQARGAAR